MTHTFILSDESINSYGFRVMTNGINTSSFEKNPVALAMHERGVLQVIGRWVNLRREGKQLLADIEFDEADEFAMKIKGKVDRGFLKAASIGIDILELSDTDEMLFEGQYRPTVTRSEMFEASIVDIGSNKNALKLNFPNKGVTLSGSFDEKLLELSLPRIGNQTDKLNEMESVKTKLGLSKDADEKAVLDALNAQLKANDGPTEKEVSLLLQLGKERGFITEKNEESYKSLAAKDFDSVLALVNNHEKAAEKQDDKKDEDTGRFSDLIAQLNKNFSGGSNSDRSKWTLGDWMEKDEAGLLKMKEEKPEQYAQLTKAYYGR